MTYYFLGRFSCAGSGGDIRREYIFQKLPGPEIGELLAGIQYADRATEMTLLAD